MAYYAVIDTNVLVSALLSHHEDASTVLVVKKIFSGDIIPCYCGDILKEYSEVLRRKKFHFSEAMLDILLRAIMRFGEQIKPSPTGVILPDPKDIVFYEVAMEGRREHDNAYLVTGNIKHFPVKPFVVTPKEMLDIMKNKNGQNKTL